jgi:hypothetical protein
MKKAKVITICGSVKFEKQMGKEAERLQLEGNCVLTCILTAISPGSAESNKNIYTPEQYALFGKLHKQKIAMSDAIFVVNVNGYFGNSTQSEIEYEKSLGKEVLYLEPIE